MLVHWRLKPVLLNVSGTPFRCHALLCLSDKSVWVRTVRVGAEDGDHRRPTAQSCEFGTTQSVRNLNVALARFKASLRRSVRPGEYISKYFLIQIPGEIFDGLRRSGGEG